MLDGYMCEGIFLVCFVVNLNGIYDRAYSEVAIKADETIWLCGEEIEKHRVLAWLDYPEYEGN